MIAILLLMKISYHPIYYLKNHNLHNSLKRFIIYLQKSPFSDNNDNDEEEDQKDQQEEEESHNKGQQGD